MLTNDLQLKLSLNFFRAFRVFRGQTAFSIAKKEPFVHEKHERHENKKTSPSVS
jgi:hypothetical protein